MANKNFDPDKPVQTKDGRKARIICKDMKLKNYGDNIILALITDTYDNEYCLSYQADGNPLNRYHECNDTLINIEENHMNDSFDPTKPVQTRDHRKVRILATDVNFGPNNQHMIVGLVTDSDGYESFHYYHSDGSCDHLISASDLVNIPTKQTLYLNIYQNADGWSVISHDNIDYAKKYTVSTIKARIKVEFEEGQFDD